MRMRRYWMTGCMALMLLAAQRWPGSNEREEADGKGHGWITLTSKRSVDETVRHIQRAARASQMAVVAQSAPAGPADAAQPPAARVLVLGDAGGQTPAMQSEQQTLPDLPLTVLVHQRADGRTEVRFPDPRALRREPGAPPDWLTRLAALPKVIRAALA